MGTPETWNVIRRGAWHTSNSLLRMGGHSLLMICLPGEFSLSFDYAGKQEVGGHLYEGGPPAGVMLGVTDSDI